MKFPAMDFILRYLYFSLFSLLSFFNTGPEMDRHAEGIQEYWYTYNMTHVYHSCTHFVWHGSRPWWYHIRWRSRSIWCFGFMISKLQSIGLEFVLLRDGNTVWIIRLKYWSQLYHRSYSKSFIFLVYLQKRTL